jgi:hypothetical protein
MNAIAQLSTRDRQDVFTEAAARTGLPPFHLEKDFWVCWTLGVLFQHPETKAHLTFRGGTSLSYARMRPMFFTEPPTFDHLLIHLREIEKSLTTFD